MILAILCCLSIFLQALESVGIKVQLKIVPNTDHFSVMHNFILADYEPTKVSFL